MMEDSPLVRNRPKVWEDAPTGLMVERATDDYLVDARTTHKRMMHREQISNTRFRHRRSRCHARHGVAGPHPVILRRKMLWHRRQGRQ
jgi:hypothetical protein